jgi:hypothetical protein
MALGYSRRCCSKTQKGTRCKLSNAFSGAFCHIHALRLSTGEVCTKAEWEVEQELLASQVEAPLAEDEEYNPCSEKFSPQAPESESGSESELFELVFGDSDFVEVPGSEVPTLKLSDKGELMMQSGEFYERFVKLLQK